MIPTDTTPEVAQLQVEVYRRMPPARKVALVQDAWNSARQMHSAGYRLRHPRATTQEVFASWLRSTLGPLANDVLEDAVESSSELTALTLSLIQTFDRLQIRCALGGSMASSIYGRPRFTHDADLTVEPFPGKEETFAASFDASYYVSLDAVRQAVREHRSFNVLHTSSGFKLDVFVRKETPFEKTAFERRRLVKLSDHPIFVLSPEDVVLFKLDWHRIGGGASDRQWEDILGVLAVQKDLLDFTYLEHWAKELDMTDALSRARREAM